VSNTATRIAMWSGPRTVSTALMRAWGRTAARAESPAPDSWEQGGW
jgi:hypothetical protein